MANDQERLATLESVSKAHDKEIGEMAADIKEIKNKLLLRPSWAVLVIITFLSTISTGLAVFVLTRL